MVEFVVEPYSSVYVMYLAISFSFKFFDVVHLLISQSIVDVFFVDWERPESHRQTSNTVSNVTSLVVLFVYLSWM